MITFIETDLASPAGGELISRIRASVEAERRTYLIVPEQQTLLMERTMCDVFPPTSIKYLEVTNFTRFADTVFRRLGGISGEYCTASAKSLIMWRTLTELSALLQMTRTQKEVGAGTVARALAAVNEMKNLSITPSDISELLSRGVIKDKRLISKLEDLALIYSAYKTIESERFSDISDDMITLSDMLRENRDYLSNADIYIDGFTSFTEPQYRLIEELIRSTSVTVVFNLPMGRKSAFEYTEIRSSEARLIAIADHAGVEKRLVHSKDDIEYPPLLKEVRDMLFLTSGRVDPEILKNEDEAEKTLRIFSASTPFTECDFIASDIKRRVMDGAMYSDFAIIARNAESYSGILNLSLDRAGIPYFFSRRRDITSFEAVKLINTAYSIITRNYAREDVITYLKCGLSDVTDTERDLFELYVERWNIDGERFVSDDFEMNPRGYEPFTEDDISDLAKINEVRRQIVDTIERFKEKTAEAKNVRDHATALYTFLSEKGLEKRLHDRSLRLSEMGEIQRAEENSRLFGMICSSLDLLVDTIGDTESSKDSFRNQLMSVLNAESISSIPSHIDEVIIGSADMLRLTGKKHVYLIGVNDGEFPQGISENSYFTNRDMEELASFGLATNPDLEIKGARELYAFTRAFSFAKKSVTILYARRSASLSPILPSEIIGRIGELTDKLIKPRDIEALPISEKLYFPEGAYEAIGCDDNGVIARALSEVGECDIANISSGKIENNDFTLGKDVAAIFLSGDLYLSQSRLESFLQCPFSYFLKHSLKLDQNERAEISSSVIGSFIHSILEDFFRESRRRGGISALSDEDKASIAEVAARRYISEYLGGGFGRERARVAISRLCRAAMPVIEGICDEFSECKYEPTLFELPLDGKAENASPIIYKDEDGRRVIIRGMVDRVDTFKSDGEVFVRVIDYKTGSKEFSPKDLEEGVNLQMFLYLKSIVDTVSEEFKRRLGAEASDTLVPSGVIYTKTSINDAMIKHADTESALEAARDLSGREGMVLDDERALGAMNPRYTPLKYPETSKNAKSNSERRYSMEDWQEICNGMEKTILEISGRMRSGDISASPKQIKKSNPCDFCSYKAICRSAE